MSTLIPFQRNFLRYSENIPAGLTPERKRIVLSVERPWARGLDRLLADRRLKKGDLADLAGVRAGTVSAVANSPRPPEIPTLQKLIDGFTKFDRQQNPNAPDVPLWEFFVSDEQAAMLSQAAHQRQQAVKQEDLVALVAQRIAPAIASAVREATGGSSLSGQPVAPAASVNSDSTEHPPAAANVDTEPARGRLRYRKASA